MKKIIAPLLIITLAGCAHLPKETVMLSGEMGTMIQSARASHMALLDEYQRERRGRIDDYMESTWIPRFIKTMAKDGDLWGKTCAIKNTFDAALELQGFVEAAAQQIAKKRKELTDSLDDSMIELRAAVDQHYGMLELSNKTVTDNLRSVRSNDEVFEETLKMVKLPKPVIALREASDKLDKLMK